MELNTAVSLIRKGLNNIISSTWADLGCGSGTFTQALAVLLPEGSTIYAVDNKKSALEKLHIGPFVNLKKVKADFIHDFNPEAPIDGILMANSLHFVKDKTGFIRKADTWLKESGSILLVEYDMDTPNPWVPYPISFYTATQLFTNLHYPLIEKTGELPSIYNRAGFYSMLVKKA